MYRNIWCFWLQYNLLILRIKFHLFPWGLPDQSYQHHLIWWQTKALFRTRHFTYRQLYLSNKYMSTFLLSPEMESCMRRTMVSKIMVQKYRRGLKEDSHHARLWLAIIVLQFLLPFTGGTYGASRWNWKDERRQGRYRGKAVTFTYEKSHRARLALEVINPPLKQGAGCYCL